MTGPPFLLDSKANQSSVQNNMKFYEAENCNRKIESNGRAYKFHPWGTIGGSLCGVFCGTTDEQVADLDALVATPKSLVRQITEDEYNRLLGVRAIRQPSSFISADSGTGMRPPKPRTEVIIEQAKIRTDTENAPGKQAATIIEAEVIPVAKAEPAKVDDILKPGKVEMPSNQPKK